MWRYAHTSFAMGGAATKNFVLSESLLSFDKTQGL